MIEIAAKSIELDGSSQTYHCFVNANKLPDKIIEITGITDQILADEGIPFEKAMTGLLEFIGFDKPETAENVFMVGHNMIKFDKAFLYEGMRMLSCKQPKNFNGWDTAGHYKAIALNDKRRGTESILDWHLRALNTPKAGLFFKLVLCCEKAGINFDGAHRADADVEMTLRLFLSQYEKFYNIPNLLNNYIKKQDEQSINSSESGSGGDIKSIDKTTIPESRRSDIENERDRPPVEQAHVEQVAPGSVVNGPVSE